MFYELEGRNRKLTDAELVYRATSYCPKCGSDNILSDGVEFQDDCIVANMGCGACGREWIVLYEAHGVYEK